MLRSWHEKGKISDVWKPLQLVLAHSTEVYITLDYHQSPFNAGVPVELEKLNLHLFAYLRAPLGFKNSPSPPTSPASSSQSPSLSPNLPKNQNAFPHAL